MNKIIKGLTLTAIVLGLGASGISCGKKEKPKPVVEQPVTPSYKHDPAFTISPIERNGINVIPYVVKNLEHVWDISRRSVKDYNEGKQPTEEWLRPYARYVIENNQHLARKEYDEVWFNSKDEVMNPLHFIMPGDTLYLPWNYPKKFK